MISGAAFVQTTTMMPQQQPPTKTSRYDRLQAATTMALTKSKSRLNVEQIVQHCYGDTADLYEPGLLETVVNNAMDAINAAAETRARVYCNSSNSCQENTNGCTLKETLDRVDAIVASLERQDMIKKQADLNDKQATASAILAASLPPDTVPEKLVDQQTAVPLLQTHVQLTNEVKQLQREINDMETLQQQYARAVAEQLSLVVQPSIAQLAERLEQAEWTMAETTSAGSNADNYFG